MIIKSLSLAGWSLQEYIVNITKPLGIAIEESPDRSGRDSFVGLFSYATSLSKSTLGC